MRWRYSEHQYRMHFHWHQTIRHRHRRCLHCLQFRHRQYQWFRLNQVGKRRQHRVRNRRHRRCLRCHQFRHHLCPQILMHQVGKRRQHRVRNRHRRQYPQQEAGYWSKCRLIRLAFHHRRCRWMRICRSGMHLDPWCKFH